MRTETEAWNNDTKTISDVEKEIENVGVIEGNYFDLMIKIMTVQDRSSLGARKGNRYYKRMLYCKKLMDKINTKKNDILPK